MRRHQLDLSRYDTDKIPNGYLEYYDRVLEPWIGRKIVLLELGVRYGWLPKPVARLFPRWEHRGGGFAPSDGIGTRRSNPCVPRKPGRQHVSVYSHTEVAPGGFDIIIDDASHIGHLTKLWFLASLRDSLRPGGPLHDRRLGHWLLRRPARWQALHGASPESRRSVDVLPYARARASEDPQHLALLRHGGLCQAVGGRARSGRILTRGARAGRPSRASRFESLLIAPIVFVTKRS